MDLVEERTGLAPAIADAARQAGFAWAKAKGLKRLSGGASKESWAFTLTQPGRPDRHMVLRRQPAEKRFTHTGIASLNVEAALLGALHGKGVPVPEVFFGLPENSPAGEGYAMARIDGETVGVRILKSPDLAGVRPKLAFECGQILAAIHAVPRAAHPQLSELSPGAALDSLRQRHRDIGQCRPVFDHALAWLDWHLPMDEQTCLVHGDFRNGNLVIGPDGVRAVLDWELAHVGAPVSDLAWLCVTSWRFQNPSLPVGGFGTRQQLLDGYAAGGGGPVRPESLHAWEVYQTLNWGLMCAEAGRNFMQGVRTVEGAMIARRASETEFDLLQLLHPGHEAWHA